MTQPTLTEIRQALATWLTNQGLRATPNLFGQVNPPCAIVLPDTGVFAEYSQSMDGQVNYNLRILIVVSAADSASGQDILDPYLDTVSPQSVYAAIRADPTLGGALPGFARVTQASGYGVINLNAIDYLGASVVVEIGV